MQLTGPPKINGWQAPMPSFQTPMDGSWVKDSDINTEVKLRTGTIQQVGEVAWRGRWRVVWDALTYDTAQRILFEVGAARRGGTSVSGSNVGRGAFLWTPRTRKPGDPEAIDIDGDGIVDIVLQEVEIPCRIREQPSTTPIYRRTPDGTKRARIELQIESTETYAERAGFGFPPSISFTVDPSRGTSFDFDFFDDTGSPTDRIAQVIVADGNGDNIDDLVYPDDFPYTLPSNAKSMTAVGTPDLSQIEELQLSGAVRLDSIDIEELTDTSVLDLQSGTNISYYGELQQKATKGVVEFYGQGEVRASLSIFGDATILSSDGTDLYGPLGALSGLTFLGIGAQSNSTSFSGTLDNSLFDTSGPIDRIDVSSQYGYELDLDSLSQMGVQIDFVDFNFCDFDASGTVVGGVGDFFSGNDIVFLRANSSNDIQGDLTKTNVKSATEVISVVDCDVTKLPTDFSSADSLFNLDGRKNVSDNLSYAPGNLDNCISSIYQNRSVWSGNGLTLSFHERTSDRQFESTKTDGALDTLVGLGSNAEDGVIDYGATLFRERAIKSVVIDSFDSTATNSNGDGNGSVTVTFAFLPRPGKITPKYVERIDTGTYEFDEGTPGSPSWTAALWQPGLGTGHPQYEQQFRLIGSGGGDHGVYEVYDHEIVSTTTDGDGVIDSATIEIYVDGSPNLSSSLSSLDGAVASDDKIVTYFQPTSAP